MIQEYWFEILLVLALIFMIIRDGRGPDDYDLQEKDAPTPYNENELTWT